MSTARMLLVVFLLLLPLVCVVAADQNVPSTQQVLPPARSQAISLAEVTSRAAEVEALLQTYRTLQAGPPATALIEKQLPEASALIGLELERTQRLLREQPTLEMLETMHLAWERRQHLMTLWLDPITRRIAQLQAALTHLAEQRETWVQTKEAARTAKATEPLIAQIAGVLAAIEGSQMALQA